MIWKAGYGMMGRWRFDQWPGMPVMPDQAQKLARQYLDTQGLPLDLADPEPFYGYYTLHTLRQGEIEGMISVNGYSGEVWCHTWHGPFIRM